MIEILGIPRWKNSQFKSSIIILIVFKSFKKCKKNLQNYCGSKNLLSVFQMFTKGLSLQKVPIVLAIASKSVDRFYRSLENLPIVMACLQKVLFFAILLKRIYLRHLNKRITRASIVEIVRPMIPKHEKQRFCCWFGVLSETVFRYFAQVHLLTALK